VARYVIPFRPNGKTRLGDPRLAVCMVDDVIGAVMRVSDEPLIADDRGGLGEAVSAALATLSGAVTIVNGDCPCVTSEELEELTANAPALVAARDGTTNAIALADAKDFAALYGPGSAERFEAHLGARRLDLPGLRDDVDTWDDLERVRARVGTHTQGYLQQLERARAS
jgi:2-phospho-L-lactate guanylyltransferase (CobY/MobA/RfbA family)